MSRAGAAYRKLAGYVALAHVRVYCVRLQTSIFKLHACCAKLHFAVVNQVTMASIGRHILTFI